MTMVRGVRFPAVFFEGHCTRAIGLAYQMLPEAYNVRRSKRRSPVNVEQVAAAYTGLLHLAIILYYGILYFGGME
jgi:hypothetical protein